MKLSKNKISKLLKHTVQSRKQIKQKKQKKQKKQRGGRTFKNKRKHINLRTKTLKKYVGRGRQVEDIELTEFVAPYDVENEPLTDVSSVESDKSIENSRTIKLRESTNVQELIKTIDNGDNQYNYQWTNLLAKAKENKLENLLNNESDITSAIDATKQSIKDDINKINSINEIINKLKTPGSTLSSSEKELLDTYSSEKIYDDPFTTKSPENKLVELVNRIKQNLTILQVQNFKQYKRALDI